MPQPNRAIKLNRIKRPGRSSSDDDSGQPRHRRFQLRQPLHRPTKLRQLIHTARQVRHRRQLRLQSRHTVERWLQRRHRLEARPHLRQSIHRRSQRRRGFEPRPYLHQARHRRLQLRQRAHRRIEAGHAPHRLTQFGHALQRRLQRGHRASSARAAVPRLAAPARAPAWTAVDCLIVSLLATMAAVLARMFSLFSRRVIASEQPLLTIVASEIWMSRSRAVMVPRSVSDPCSAIARVLECHHSCAATSAVTHHAKASLVRSHEVSGRGCWRRSRLESSSLAWVVVSLRIDRPVAYDDIEEHFKYGSIGSEPGVSLLQPVGGVLPPYWVFRALPAICPDRIRGGYESFGFTMEPATTCPIGVSRRRRVGLDHVGHELRRLPQRHRARYAHVATSSGARDAVAQARPAGLRAVRPRVHARQPAHAGRRAGAVSRQRRAAVPLRARAPARSA